MTHAAYPLFLRQQALQALTQPAATIQQVAEQFGLSRATLHTWVKRAREEGNSGLLERSRAPRRSPQTLPAHWAQELSPCGAHARVGAPPSSSLSSRTHPRARRLPAFVRWSAGCAPPIERATAPRSRRGPACPPGAHRGATAQRRLDLDFKGWFRTGDGARCHALTVRDLASRFLLPCASSRSRAMPRSGPYSWLAFRRWAAPG